jgi:ribose 1,5-bisphosphokinase
VRTCPRCALAPGLRVVEIGAPADVLARRLAARAREDAATRDSRLARAVPVPVEADLVLINDGELQHCVDRLVQWWQAGCDA